MAVFHSTADLNAIFSNSSSSLQHNIPRSFCLVLVFWNLLQTAFSFFVIIFVTSSFL